MAQYNDPQRFAQIERLHANAFSWQSQDRIPLGIHVINPQHSRSLSYQDIWLRPEILLDVQTKQLADTLEVGSDLLPVIGINHFGDVVLPSLFGAAQHMPDGMGLISCHGAGVFEHTSRLLGYVGLCTLLYDAHDLVRAVVDRVGGLIEGYHRRLLQLDRLVAIFQGDDMGFRSGTLISPEHMREYFLPWHKRFAQLAHQAGRPYFLHSCGNLEAIMNDLIDDVGIDAKHSFEDAIVPVDEMKRRYGDRIGILGGVDVDVLGRAGPDQVRRAVRAVIDACAPGGRYAVGSGNSIPSYVPPENYLTMLDEALA